jgi:hypothetical protein
MNGTTLIRALALLVALACASCTNVSPTAKLVFDDALPPVAAQYRSHISDHGKELFVTHWRIWRQDNRIEREDIRQQTGEIWQRDGETLFHSQLFHADKRGIEYQPGDLKLVGADTRWTPTAWIVNPQLLQKLTVTSERVRDGVTYRRYTGRHADWEWDITLRLDVMLPQSVERKRDHFVERIELREVHAFAQAPWQPTPSRDYAMIDFADLGDHERDHFVIRLQAASHAGTAHQH